MSGKRRPLLNLKAAAGAWHSHGPKQLRGTPAFTFTASLSTRSCRAAAVLLDAARNETAQALAPLRAAIADADAGIAAATAEVDRLRVEVERGDRAIVAQLQLRLQATPTTSRLR